MALYSGGDVIAQDDTSGRSIEEVVVTANKREESILDIAGGVTVLSGTQLEQANVASVEDLYRLEPTIEHAAFPGNARPSIRGFGGENFESTATDAVVGVVDGAIRKLNGFGYYDIERMEVLPGPQGLLFGASSSAGILNITTRSPDPSGVSAGISFTNGSHGMFNYNGFANIPIGEKAALRIAGQNRRDPTTATNVLASSGDNPDHASSYEGARVRFLWLPTDRLTVDLAADWNNQLLSGGHYQTYSYAEPGSELERLYLDLCGIQINEENTKACKNGPGNFLEYDVTGLTANISYEFENGLTFVSTTGYEDTQYNIDRGIDMAPVTWINQWVEDTDEAFTQEFRIVSPDETKLQYVAGVFYSTRDRVYPEGFLTSSGNQANVGPCAPDYNQSCWDTGPFGGSGTNRSSTLSEQAIFAQLTYELSDSISLIGGLRVGSFEIESTQFPIAFEENPEESDYFTPTGPVYEETTKDDYVSYKLGVQYYASEDLMMFGSYTFGFKPGQINNTQPPEGFPRVLEPEEPEQIEVGFKWDLGGSLLNVTAWHTDLKNFQFQNWDVSRLVAVLINAPTAKSVGASAQLFGYIGDNFRGSVGAAYTDATYGSGTFTVSPISGVVDISGEPLAFSSEYSFNADGEYFFGLPNDLEGYLGGDLSYRSERGSDAANTPEYRLDSRLVANARIGARTSDGRFDISFWVRNLTDEFLNVYERAGFDGSRYGSPQARATLVDPYYQRTFGLTIDVGF